MGDCLVRIIGGVVAVAILCASALPWTDRTRKPGRRRGREVVDVAELRRLVIEQAAARGVRVPVGRSGHNPMTIVYTTGPESYFYTSIDAYRRDIEASRVNPDYAGWGHRSPRLVSDWSGDECRDWLSANS
jgi:hypothetical protein